MKNVRNLLAELYELDANKKVPMMYITDKLNKAIERDDKEMLNALKGSVTERAVRGKLTKGCVLNSWTKWESE